eukprot:gene9955-12207_t
MTSNLADNKFVIGGIGVGIGVAVSLLANSLLKSKNDTTTSTSTTTTTTTNSNSLNLPEEPKIKEEVNISNLTLEEIFQEQMNRTMLYYGDEGFQKIRNSFVIVVGLGGVGGAAAHNLLRSGVKKLRLIDPDNITVSSLNRNVLANRKDVGRSKVETMKAYFNQICPEVEVEAYQTFFTGDIADKLLHGKPDYVLDCIDNTKTKVELLTYCHSNGIRVISSFGAGSSRDPTKINISDISFTFGCPFGREIRRLLREKDISTGILCVYSTETNRKKLIPLTDEERTLLLEQPVKPTLRVRTLGVSMPIPFIFGTSMACNVLNDLAGLVTVVQEEKRCPPPMTEYTRIFKAFVKKENSMYRTPPTHLKKLMGPNDIRYLMDEIFDGKSAITSTASPIVSLYRWRPEKPIQLNNIVLLSQKEGEIHEKLKSVEEYYSPDVIKKVDSILLNVVGKLNQD